MSSDCVSVVVPTKNSERTLTRCLQSIREQRCSNIELLVVDNFSTDRTREIAKQYADLFLQIGPERCTQRNAGLAKSRGKFVVFVDSDMYLPPETIDSCLLAMSAGVAGVVLREKSIGEGFWSSCKAFERSFYFNDRTVTAARFFERELLLSIGGYDETMVAGDDWDISMRVEPYGTLAFASATIVHDEGRIVLLDQFRKKRYYGSTLDRFIKKHGKAGRQKISPARTSLVPALKYVIRRPRLVLGTLILKLTDLLGITFGLTSANFRSRR